ncbi:hypothetical protein Tco_1462884 [Tanacetum coccineum]
MTTPSPSPPNSLSPSSTGERLARCTTPSAHSSPPPALIDAVTAALPSPPLPPLPPSLYIPPPVDRSDDVPESDTLDAEERRRGISEVGYGIRDTWVDLAEAVHEIAPTTLGEVNTRVIELAEPHERDTQDLYALLEDAQDGRTRISQRVAMDSQRAVHHELQTHRDHVYAHETHIQALLQLQSTLIQTQHQVHETRSQIQQTKMAELQDTNRRHKAQMVEILRVMRDMR